MRKNFQKIYAGKATTNKLMIIARIESLILGKPLNDAIKERKIMLMQELIMI